MRTRYVGSKVRQNPRQSNRFSSDHKKDFSVFYDHVTFLMMQRFILWHKDLFYHRAGNKKTEKHSIRNGKTSFPVFENSVSRQIFACIKECDNGVYKAGETYSCLSGMWRSDKVRTCRQEILLRRMPCQEFQ